MRLQIISVFMLGTAACGSPESNGQNLDATVEATPDATVEATPDATVEATPDATVETTPDATAEAETVPEEVAIETTAETSPEVVVPGVSPVTGVDTNVTVTEPERAGGCDDSDVDPADYGASYPWGGLTAGGKSFTCNSCPNGLEGFSGVWRAFGDEDFSIGSGANDTDIDRLAIDGNTFFGYTRFDGVESEFRGWFLCSQQPEHPNEHLYWVVLDASGPLYTAGAVYRTNRILSSGDDQRLLEYFDDLETTSSFLLPYCRIGARDEEGRLCNDPLTP